MRRLGLVCAVAMIAGLGAVASAAPGGTRALLRNFVCRPALHQAARKASITAFMRPLPGTAKMALRFELLKRSNRHGRATSLPGPGLRGWAYPPPKQPPLGERAGDRWIVKHPVSGLAAPAFYQFRVTFRWSDSAGRTIGRAVRLTRQCWQPELRPDLRVVAVNTQASVVHPGNDLFDALIRNAGKTAAGTFDVQLADGEVVTTKTLPGLGPHATVHVHFEGPACSAAAPATITADPAGAIDDADPSNNAMTVTCG